MHPAVPCTCPAAPLSFSEGWKPGQPTQRVHGKLVVGDAAALAAAGGYRPLSGAGVVTDGEFKLHNLAEAEVVDECDYAFSFFVPGQNSH
jgi:hypothetical protein